MLYDFHKNQNAKRANSVHATYLLIGNPRTESAEATNNAQTQDEDDSIMQSSPFPSSYPEPEPPLEFEDEDVDPVEENIPTTIVTLVKEEDLDGTYSCLSHTRIMSNDGQRRKKTLMKLPPSAYTAYSPGRHQT
jgi:DNA polymerase delta subunit 3